jgi:tRNA-specific 2-thiouridylase
MLGGTGLRVGFADMISDRGKVVVAMSGGVDSSVAACLLHEQGYDVIGLFMCMGRHDEGGPAGESVADEDAIRSGRHLGCCTPIDAGDARGVALKLGVPFFSLDFKRRFDEIVEYFAAEYARGRTPNPCILCNQNLKFGRLAEYGQSVGADFVATGHYARIDRQGDRYRLRRAADTTKDQSYVLFGIGRDMLPRTLFPIGELTKDEVRAHARRLGLQVSEKSESQDICFAPDRDYARIVRRLHPEAFCEGPIVDAQGNQIGRHQGIAHFTIGQRRGLNVAMGKPIYVTRIDAARNTIVTGTPADLASDRLEASNVQWLADVPTSPFRAHVQIRYTHKAAPALVEPIGSDRARVRFDEAQTAITPGQAAVFYADDVVVGGGWIDWTGGEP